MKSGQVWIETVIYTLIAFVMIGAVLTFAKPKIEELQDETLIEQSIGMIKEIDSLIFSVVQGGPGNKRLIDVGISKGALKIDGVNDKIIFEIESKYAYSEPGKDISEGDLKIRTEEKGKLNLVNISRDYSGNYDILFEGSQKIKSLSKASTSYSLLISNNGKTDNGTLWEIDIRIA
jgi:hypothetical protein